MDYIIIAIIFFFIGYEWSGEAVVGNIYEHPHLLHVKETDA